MLRLLGNTLEYCQKNQKTCVPLLEKNSAFAIPFYSIFKGEADLVADEATYNSFLQSDFIYNGKTFRLKNISKRHVKLKSGRDEYRICVPNQKFPGFSLNLDNMSQVYPAPVTVGIFSKTWGDQIAAWTFVLSKIHIKEEIKTLISEKRKNLPENFIGVHFRNTDKESDFSTICGQLEKLVDETSVDAIYWATDDIHSIEKAKKLFPRCAIHNFTKLFDPAGLGFNNLHYIKENILLEKGYSKKDQIIDTLADIYLLATSSRFIPTQKSGLSKLVEIMRSKTDLISSFFGIPEVAATPVRYQVTEVNLMQSNHNQYYNKKSDFSKASYPPLGAGKPIETNISSSNRETFKNRKKLTLHAGIHKTGTTSIQKVLFDNRTWLAEKGFFYPVLTPFVGARPHHNFAQAIASGNQFHTKKAQRFVRNIGKMAQPGDALIISAEPIYRHLLGGDGWAGLVAKDYYKTRNAYLSALAECLKDFDVEVILYFRDSSYWLPWLHGVLKRKKIWTDGLERFTQEFGARFAYENQLELFSAHFSKIRTFQYEEAKAEGLIPHFFRAIGCPMPPGANSVWERPTKKPQRKREEVLKIQSQEEQELAVEVASNPTLEAPAVPPEEIPAALRDRYTLGGTIPVQARYFNQTKSEPRRLTLEKYKKVLNGLKAGTFQYYGNTLPRILAATKDFPLTGKHVCVFGAVNVNCDAIALSSGAEKVDILEYNVPVTEHPQVECLSLREALQKGLQWDAAFSISSFEHDGLGRYGDPLDPDGDLRAMGEARRMLETGALLYLAVPVGPDCLVWNAHRVYGKKRLPMLLDSWEVVKTYGYSKKLHDLPVGKHSQPVFVLRKNE